VELIISHAAVQDAEAILTLQRLAYQSEARLYNDWTLPPLTETLEELQAEFARHLFLKALMNNRIVGSVRARMQDAPTCMIGRLMVHPDYQRRGIGMRLMQAVERQFEHAGRFELFTGYKSTPNIRLYQRLGYREMQPSPERAHPVIVYMEKVSRDRG
jgi:GNAT superfamily N-acetyltransferase